ncbi:hypothetical protein FACS189483_10500 [Spirochaetia bacterium]|nr:hypothetical protein FACS189483_10500 [Spirochaetia bacterium]
MKKAFAIMMVAVVMGTSAFALDLSAGIGGLFTADFTDTFSTDDLTKDAFKDNYEDYQLLGGGFNLFFDATYAELNIGMAFGSRGSLYKDATEDSKVGGKYAINTTALRIGLLGKYPIAITDTITLFPLLGLDYEIVLGMQQDGNDLTKSPYNLKTADYGALWFKLGVGGDIALTDRLYLRPEFLYGIRLNTQAEIDQGKEDVYGSSKKYSDVLGVVGHGLDIKISVGYRF